MSFTNLFGKTSGNLLRVSLDAVDDTTVRKTLSLTLRNLQTSKGDEMWSQGKAGR